MSGSEPRKSTPLPARQMLMICIVTFVEPVQFGVLFPFVYFMVKSFNVSDDEKELGSYIGLLASSFCIAQLLTALPWGYLSDRIGRRPVVVIGLLGNAITCTLFGISKSFTWAIVTRSLCGLLNGNLGVIKSMLGEMTDETNRGRAFSYWEAAYGIGTIVGPMLGGLLVDPASQYPNVFGKWELLKTYPYLLPCFASSIVSIIGAVLGLVFLQEYRNIKHSNRDSVSTVNENTRLLDENEIFVAPSSSQVSLESQNEAVPIMKVLTPKVCMSILCYATWCLITVIYEEVYALYVAEPLRHGGLQFTSFEIGLALSLTGFVQVFTQLFIYPALESSIGNAKTFRLGSILMIIFSFLLPFTTDFAKWFGIVDNYTHDQKVVVFIVLFILLTGKTIASILGYVPVIIFVNDAAPSANTLGTVHGFGQISASLVRSCGPALSGYLWSWSLGNSMFPFDFHFTLLLVSALSLIALVESYEIEKYAK